MTMCNCNQGRPPTGIVIEPGSESTWVNEKLKPLPCPFCGSSKIAPLKCQGADWVACDECGVLGSLYQWNRRAALADPVSPAGGQPVTKVYTCELPIFEEGGMTSEETPMVKFSDHHAHITRLQTEVERLKAEWDKEAKEWYAAAGEDDVLVRNLQSELTKARDALLKILHASEWTRHDAHYREVAQTLADKATNQSAPADKGRPKPYGYMFHPDGRKDEEFFIYEAPKERVPDIHGEYWTSTPLYAEQPAPVSAAICKHCGWPHINETESCDDATKRERGKP